MRFRLIHRCTLLVLLALLSACAHAPSEVTPPPEGKVFRAVTTWYGPGFNGRRTASGEVFDMDGMTAAHKTFPFGTRLKVTNPKNGKSVVVVVNDRGPFVAGRDLDLSKGAAFAIEAYKMCEVDVEVLGRDMSYVREVKTGALGRSGSYWVQVGAFKESKNAEGLARTLRSEGFTVQVATVTRDEALHVVRVGGYPDRSKAAAAREELQGKGHSGFVTHGPAK